MKNGYFINLKEFLQFAEDNGIPKNHIEAVSMGDNGFWVFIWNGEKIVKIKLGSLGVTYINEERAMNFFNEYFPNR